ncbi:MAG: type I secretion system permease/ATPase [Emcibacter sp.]|nr:type I secretion system permease/ATPase [Emcibacter sp.]
MADTLVDEDSLLKDVLMRVKRAAKQVAAFSFIINLLLLVSPIYMLQLYDRVLSSGSKDTLLVLSIIALFLLGLLGLLEVVRNRIMTCTGADVDRDLKDDVFEGIINQAALRKNDNNGQGIRDLDSIRQFVSSNAPFAFFDAPWTPFFIIVVALLHPLLGLVALIGAVIIFCLAIATEVVSRELLKKSAGHQMQSHSFIESILRNNDVLRAMNIASGLKSKWAGRRDPAIQLQVIANQRVGILLGSTKAVRIAIQVIILGTGGYLALDQPITPGAIVAASIITGRALAPVEQAIGAWRQVVAARGAYRRLITLLNQSAEKDQPMPLPRPEGNLNVSGLVGALPKAKEPILKGISFELKEGELLGMIGPSGAGKTFLARHLIGVWPAIRGSVRLGGVDISAWHDSDRGQYIGYLPQDIELFPGTIAENISRFTDADADKVVEAARLAGCHDLILGLPQNYDTIIGNGGMFLSGGQSQRIALARALYNSPVLVVLDEPNSNLDTEGEVALGQCLNELKKNGTTIVIITHNIRALQAADKVLVVKEGTVASFGPRDEILKQFMKPSSAVMPIRPNKIKAGSKSHD